MNPKFHERFDIKVSVEEARRRFTNRVKNLIYQSFLNNKFNYETRKEIIRLVVSKLGEKYDRSILLESHIGDDFLRNLQAVESLHSVIPSNENLLVKLIQEILAESEVDIGVRWEGDRFMPSGATLLDEKLANEALRWLSKSGYESVLGPFQKGLEHFLHSEKRPELLSDVITDMYEALEALAKIITKRPDRDLSANRELFLQNVKASEEYKQLLKDYIEYANKFRHAVKEGLAKPKLTNKEVESFIYLTGLFLRLAMP